MVFKRREKRSLFKSAIEYLWPRTGYARAFNYVRLRLKRIPDQPHRIARGIFAGVFVTFSPFYGLHFLLAAFFAMLLRGNVIAALFATFIGNPLTFFLIATISIQTGNFLLGRTGVEHEEVHKSVGGKFVDAWGDLKDNFLVLFTDGVADWSGLYVFYDEVFFPYMVGSIIPGLIAGIIAYYVSLPLIQAYKNRRRGLLKAKFLALKEKAAAKANTKSKQD